MKQGVSEQAGAESGAENPAVEIEASLLSLDEDQKAVVVERFVAEDVFRRLCLDLGKSLIEKSPSISTGMSRLKEVKEYVRESIAASFRKLRDAGRRFTSTGIEAIVRSALKDTFEIFEGYVA